MIYTLVCWITTIGFMFNIGPLFWGMTGCLDLILMLIWSTNMYFSVMINRPWRGAEGQGTTDLITGNKKARLSVVLAFSVVNM